ncbi:MAG: helix-hairpin-helix domain-containing protein [Promethearchaeota archaeon]
MANGIGKETVEKMLKIGINSVEKLASASIESLLVIDDIGIKSANSYIQFAKSHLERIKAREKIYNIINKGVDSNLSGSQDISSGRKRHGKKSKLQIPISSIQKLASSSMEDVSKLEEIGIPTAKRYVEIAKKYLESMRIEEEKDDTSKEELVSSSKSVPEKQLIGFIKLEGKSEQKSIKTEIPTPKVKTEIKAEVKTQQFKKFVKPGKVKTVPLKKLQVEFKPIKRPAPKGNVVSTPKKEGIKKQAQLKTFFPEATMQKIRFLHFNIKKLEEKLHRNEDFSFSELNHIIDYIKILNVNYKTQSQIRIFKELEITPSFYDPVEKKEIRIWDLIFECSRALWISAQAYSCLATKFESENLMENAIVASVECSKMYKTSAYFSAACTRQEDRGKVLSVENLEMNSEESRILAQNLATISEERKGNFSMASSLSAGLSALTKRLAFLRVYDEIKEHQFKAQYIYDMSRACHLKAQSLLKVSHEGENEKLIENLQKKANYYYIKAEEIWEHMLENFNNLTDAEKESIKTNLSIVNENIIENDVELIDDNKALEIQDPEPLIIIPENLAPFIPRTTNFLTKYKQSDLNFDAYLRYKNLMSDVLINIDKIDELQNKKAGIGRTMKQLKILYDNTDIDINSFTELYEKYSIKLEAIENAIRKIKTPVNRNPAKKRPVSKMPVKIFKPKR